MRHFRLARSTVVAALLLVATLPFLPLSARAATAQSCTASEAYEFGSIGSRHCEITITCPAGTCTWQVGVGVSGYGVVHGWISDTTLDCRGVNSCASSSPFVLNAGQSRILTCLVDSPVIAVNLVMVCTGNPK